MTGPKSASATTKAKEPAAKDDEICGLCWPAGWPHNHESAGCVHGTWDRTI